MKDEPIKVALDEEVVMNDGGAKKVAAEREMDEHMVDFVSNEPKPKKSEETKEKFMRVIFQAKSNESQPGEVTLSLNGVTLVLQREKPVVLPASFLEVADQAVINGMKWEMVGEKSVMTPTKIRKFPYSVIDPNATEREYLEMRNRGTETTRRTLKAKEVE